MKARVLTMAIAAALFSAATPAALLAHEGRPQPGDNDTTTKTVDLRPKFVKGREVKFKMTIRSRGMGGPSEGDEGTGESEQEMVIRLKPKETNPDTGTTLELVYESLKVNMGEIKFDSTKPAEKGDPVDDLFRSIVGLKMNVQMDPNGNITSVTHEGGSGVGDLLAQQFTGADVIKGLFGPISTRKASDGRAKVGETWKTDDTMRAAFGNTTLAMTHTLESARSSRATIKTRGKVTIDGSDGTGLGFKVKDSSITGTTEWDLDGGMLTRMTQDNRLVVEAPDKDGAIKDQTHTMRVEVTRVR
ncbi:MAG: DUF6263 family protein [Phycisphaerales bacterium]